MAEPKQKSRNSRKKKRLQQPVAKTETQPVKPIPVNRAEALQAYNDFMGRSPYTVHTHKHGDVDLDDRGQPWRFL